MKWLKGRRVLALLSPGGGKRVRARAGCGEGKTHQRSCSATHPTQAGGGAPTGGGEWMDCYRALGAATDRKGQEDPTLAFLLPESRTVLGGFSRT